MAISGTHYQILRTIPVTRGSSLLEIGEANWYGDLDPASVGLNPLESMFEVAKSFYQQWFAPCLSTAIDNNGSHSALRLDLNSEIHLALQYGVVINHGTAEHVFDIARVFRTIHDHCVLDGWMIHDVPFFGWIDHGFYTLQPTLFYDLAHANNYEIYGVWVHESRTASVMRLASRDDTHRLTFPLNSMLLVAMRKRVDQPFRVPYQGYYSQSLSSNAKRAWEHNR